MSSRDRALSLSQVLIEECVEHFGETLPNDIAAGYGDSPERTARIFQYLNTRNRWALCLSGGGVRSATFGLGLLQGLARRNLLSRFDYLSTVSGGGYIGSWLSAWANRRTDSGERIGIEEVQRELGRTIRGGEEVPEISHLRNYSTYLSQKFALTSEDTWARISIYLRNLLLLWLMLIPLFLLPAFPVYIGWQLLHGKASMIGTWIAFAVGAVALFWVVGFLSFNLPSARAWPLLRYLSDQEAIAAIQGRSQGEFLVYCLLPSAFASACLSLALAWFWQQDDPLPSAGLVGSLIGGLKVYFGGYWQIPLLVVGGAIGRLIAWYVALWRVFLTNRRIQRKMLELGAAGASLNPSHNLTLPIILWELTASLLCGAVGGLFVGITIVHSMGNPFIPVEVFGNEISAVTHAALYLCFAPPLFLLSLLLSESLFIGLTAYVTKDEDREWWGRAGAWLLIAAVTWFSWNLLVIFAPVAFSWLSQRAREYVNIEYYESFSTIFSALPGALSLISGIATVLLGAKPQKAGSRFAVLRTTTLLLATGLFIVSMFGSLVWALSALLFELGGGMDLVSCTPDPKPTCILEDVIVSVDGIPKWSAAGVLAQQQAVPWPFLILTFFALASMGAVVWRSFNVNSLSMLTTNRDRLVRCYLGAARSLGMQKLRYPDRFTGFDPNDNLPMRELAKNASRGTSKSGPLHIVNTSVSLVNEKMIGWQQRKTASFTMSPLHAGSDVVGYRPTSDYGGDQGISLGMAMAVSGSAASPDIGHHSSPIVSLILAMLNLRLGLWLGNPRSSTRTGPYRRPLYSVDGPIWAVGPLLAEWFGQTNRRSPFVYLSDGGHFENLGLYEMVRRRCRHIIVSDASCDPEDLLSDLGRAIRTIRADLGIDIVMEMMFDSPRDKKYVPGVYRTGFYCGIGRIEYPEGDPGTLVYIKPGLFGGEPRDVINYAREHPEFPHEYMVSHAFTAAQFESYRRLGEHVAERVVDAIGTDEIDLKRLVESVTKAARRA